jgi:branched-chain amino acid transport system substrate-binding protein
LTGALSFDGPNIELGAQMAIEDFQAGRGNLDGSPSYVPEGTPDQVGDVNLLVRDSETAADAGMRKARDLVESEGVDFLFGGYSTDFTVNLAQYVNSEEVYTMIPASASTAMTGEHRGKWHFHSFGNADQTSKAIGDHLMPKDDWNDIYIIYEDYGWGNDWLGSITERIEAHDGSVVGTAGASLGASDYSSFISQAISSDADSVIAPVVSATNFLEQAAQLGLREEKNVAIGFYVLPYGQGIAQEDFSGIWAPSKWYMLMQNERTRNFVSRYYDMHEKIPTAVSTSSYMSMMETLRAFDAVGDDQESVIEHLEDRTFTYFKGEDEYFRDCDHQRVQQIGIGRGYETRPDWSQFDLDVADPEAYSLMEIQGMVGGDESLLPACEDLPGSMD